MLSLMEINDLKTAMRKGNSVYSNRNGGGGGGGGGVGGEYRT
jgi:hypothetical protein